MVEENQEHLTGIRWEIIKEIAKSPKSPKQLSENLGSTLANISQQLKLLEAYNYIKRKRVDKGKGGRTNGDTRVLYSLSKSIFSITSITPYNVLKKDLKLTPLTSYMANVLLHDLKEEAEALLKFNIDFKDLFNEIDSLFYIKTEQTKEGADIHLFVITEALEKFRGPKSKLNIISNEGVGQNIGLRFWSHTLAEVKAGLNAKEQYFLDQTKNVKLLYEKKTNYASQILGDVNE